MAQGNETKMFKKADLLIILFALVIGIAGLIWYRLGSKPGLKVEVVLDGKVVETFNLNQNIVYQVKTEKGNNTIVIEDGKVYVSESDCPDGICKSYKPADKTNQTIICLPHKLVIQVVE